MFAINHASAALLFKKKYPALSIIWLLICVQLVEYFWVFLNYLGIEKTTTNETVKYIGDIHLSYMPFSHSFLTTVLLALVVYVVVRFMFGNAKLALILTLAISSHFFLDLLVHAKDLPLWYFTIDPRFGTNMYPALPYLAFAVEFVFGLICWWYYGGSKKLLAVIIIFNLLNFTTFSPNIIGLEKYFANRTLLLTTVIFSQIIITSFLVWYFSSKSQVENRTIS